MCPAYVGCAHVLPGLQSYSIVTPDTSPAHPACLSASAWVPDAIIINIGENDFKYPNKTPAWIQTFTNALIKLVTDMVTAYGVPSMPVFLMIAPHEAGESQHMHAITCMMCSHLFA